MEIDLANIPCNIGENTQVTIRALRTDMELMEEYLTHKKRLDVKHAPDTT